MMPDGDIELNEIEATWLNSFSSLIKKKPRALTLVINSLDDGEIMVLSKPGKLFTKLQKKWIADINKKITKIPENLWLVANDDGWNAGKGKPKMYGYVVVGTGGAMGGCSDNFSDHYIESFDVEDYGTFDEDSLYETHEITRINASTSNLNIEHIDGHPPMWS